MPPTMKAKGPRDRSGPWFQIAMQDDAAELWIFGEIGWEVSVNEFAQQLSDLGQVGAISVRINSLGGVAPDGVAIYNLLKRHAATVTVYVEGIAASAASLIAMAGDEIVMREGTLMMIHDPSGWARGTVEELHKYADALDKLRGQVVAIYASRSGQAEDAVREIMRAETWYTGEEAVAAGFANRVDGAAEPETMRAAAMEAVMHLPNVPPALAAALRAEPASNPGESPMNLKTPKAPEQPVATPAPAPEQAPEMTAPKAPAPATPPAPVAQPEMNAVEAERQRTKTILSAARMAGVDQGFAMKLVEEGVSAEAAVMKIQEQWAGQDQTPEPQMHARITMDARDKFVEGATQALMARGGVTKPDQIKLQGNEFVGLSLRELARESLTVAGISAKGKTAMEMIGMAFAPHMAGAHSTSDFGNILANVAQKSMLKGYEEAEETFQLWTSVGTLTDFKPTKRVDLNLFPNLEKVDEGSEYTYATVGERAESTQLATYGRMFSITRQMVINDDLGAFTRIPMKMGRAAIRTVGNLVYAVLTGNPTMADGVALFHADHKNLLSAAAPATASLDALRTAMATQKDPDAIAAGGLNIRPAFIIVPVALEGTTKVAMESEYDTAKGDKRVPNSVRGMATVVSDARLDAASTTAWYGAASPVMHDTVEVSYLDGQQAPYLEQRDGWNIDGTEFKVRIDAAVKALGYLGLAKNPGA